MLKPAFRSIPFRSAAIALLAAPVAVLSACAPNEPISTQPGTDPAIWTGSPAPSAPAAHGESSSHGSGSSSAGSSSSDTVSAQLKDANGNQVAAATIEFKEGFATVTVQTTSAGKLTPGFHGLHIHTVGKCEPNSVAPAGGAPGDFLSAGGHFQTAGRTGHPDSGDLASLQVRGDGSAMLVTTTSSFTQDDLLAGDGTAIIIHADSDNFANIPPDRYQQVAGGAAGPDDVTLATGDAGKRVACGVIGTS